MTARKAGCAGKLVEVVGVARTTAPASMPRPDVFVLSKARWVDCVRNRNWPEGAPILAVEVLSPSNRNPRFRRKVELFLSHGSSAVWVVYPATRVIQVCTLDGDREYRQGEAIVLPALLPPISVGLSEIFETLG